MPPQASTFDLGTFTKLCKRLAQIDLFGTAPPSPPWGTGAPTAAAVVKAVNSGAPALPLAYRNGYVQPLLATVGPLIQRNQGQVEPFVAPVYEHAANSKVKPQLHRFLAVISNLYRSFLDDTKRAKLNIQLNEQLPPLAFFQHDGMSGPYTIPASDIATDIATSIGVVSLPSTYKDHPILWSSLAHETGGHDVVHADAGLIDELQKGVQAAIGGGHLPASGSPTPHQLQGLLWSYWMDEAVADVYGLLNIGPQFALNLTAFFSAMNAVAAREFEHQHIPLPNLRTDSGERDPQHGDHWLDEHPTDILRLDLAIGAIGTFAGLAAGRRQEYTDQIRTVATASAQGATQVTLQGILPVGQHTGVTLNSVQLPLADMQATARTVGAFIATHAFSALAGHSIQDIETWDDLDEAAANTITQKLLASQPIANLGDDAQLLAGANAALVANPALYASVTHALNDGLDASFSHDPIWAPPKADGIVAPSRLGVRARVAARRRPAEKRRKNR
jgi:hypothetical protein